MNILPSPLIHFYDHEWYPKNWYGSEDPCNRFPTGIRTTYKNDSNIPVRIVVATIKIFYGEKEIDDVVKKIETSEKSFLLPGETQYITNIQEDTIKKCLIKIQKHPNLPPYLEAELMIEFSRLNSTSHYAYTTRHIIYFHYKQPLFKGYRMIKEEIKPL